MTAADVKEVRANPPPPLTVPGHSNLNEGLRQDVQFFFYIDLAPFAILIYLLNPF